MILGITGTNGAGKGAIVEYLATKGFRHYSASGLIAREVTLRGLPLDRTSLQQVGNDLRRIHGPSYLVETLYRQAASVPGNAIVESVREIAGAVFLQEHGAFLLAVDADPRLRYERVRARGGSKDHVSFKEFREQEEREMENIGAFDMNIAKVMSMADYRISNDGTREELERHVDGMLRALGGIDS